MRRSRSVSSLKESHVEQRAWRTKHLIVAQMDDDILGLYTFSDVRSGLSENNMCSVVERLR
jgi:hypothetical protein